VRTAAVAAVVIAVGAAGGAAAPMDGDRPGKPIAGTSCSEFPASNWWHADVSDLPVHRRSRQWLSHMSTGSDLHPDFGPSYGDGPNYGIPVTVVRSSHKKVRVRFQYADESDRVRYPLGKDTKVEGGQWRSGDRHTIVIDANDYGQRGRTIVENGQALLDFDPQHNILFSTHMYQAYENPQVILDVIRGAQNARLPMIVGEFGYQHGERNGQPIPVPYEVMLDEAARAGVGYLAWSWTGNSDYVGYLDLSVNGSAAELTGWGDDIINGLNGIRSTSQRASMFAAP